MKMLHCLAIGTAALTVGCAHLEQAPLIYSSKTTLGLDISTTATESPGIALNLGFKQVDAAYVPVAVARACDPSKATALTAATPGATPAQIGNTFVSACQGENYRLQLVTGNSAKSAGASSQGEGPSPSQLTAFQDATNQFAVASGEASLAALNVKDATDRLAKAEARLNDLKAKKAGHEQRLKELPTLKAQLSQTPEGSALEVVEHARQTAQKRIDEIEASSFTEADESALAATAREVTSLANELDTRQKELQKKQTLLEEKRILLAQAQDAADLSDRNDSYSVFGSFNNKSESSTKGIATGLGKIFATGVASQNISDALTERYKAQVACYSAIAQQKNLPEDKFREMVRTCSSGQ